MAESGFDRRVEPRAFRFIFWDRFLRLWRLQAWFMRSLPLPVSRNRFLAPLLDFSFGISNYPKAWLKMKLAAGPAGEAKPFRTASSRPGL